jgi:heme-degrading monooxygenase HmoA
MSVTVTIRFPVPDVPKAIEGLQNEAALLEQIIEETKDAGLIHHRFVAGDGELLVIDEWDSAEQFQAFFDGNTKVPEVMTQIGVSGPPVVTIYESIDAPGTV